jgi:hypothetical protein
MNVAQGQRMDGSLLVHLERGVDGVAGIGGPGAMRSKDEEPLVVKVSPLLLLLV